MSILFYDTLHFISYIKIYELQLKLFQYKIWKL